MNVDELKQAINDAKTKEALEKLLLDELDINIDRRHTLANLKADVLKGIEGEGPEVTKHKPEDMELIEDNRDEARHEADKAVIAKETEVGRFTDTDANEQDAPIRTDEDETDGKVRAHTGTDHKDGEDIISGEEDKADEELDISLPHIPEAENKMPAPAKAMRHQSAGVRKTRQELEPRRLRHKETGRVYIWTPALAKKSTLEEV